MNASLERRGGKPAIRHLNIRAADGTKLKQDILAAILLWAHPASVEFGAESCTFNGIALCGEVEIVDSFPDIKVQMVDSFPGVP